MTLRPTHRSLLLTLAAAAACGDGDGAPAVTQRVDSAGIEVVVSQGAVMAGLPTWTAEQVVDLGGVSAPPEHQFFRPNDVHRRPDGALAVANTGAQQVVFLGADGSVEAAIGRDGDGPTEFRAPVSIEPLPGDSFLIYDARLNRFSVIGPGRTVDRVATIEGTYVNSVFHGLMADGLALMEGFSITPPDGSSPSTQASDLYLHALDGAQVDTVGRFPARVWVRLRDRITSPEFGAYTSFAPSGAGVWVGVAHVYEVVEVGRDGVIRRIVRWAGPDRTVTQADRERLLQQRLAAATTDEERARIEEDHARSTFAARRAAYDAIVVSDTGELWIQGFNRWQDGTPVEWLVFAADGTPLGRVNLPDRLRVHEVSGNHVSGVLTDGADVPHVVVYRVDRGAGGPTSP